MDIDLIALLQNTTIVAKIVLVILVLMSLFSWAIIFGKWISLSAAARKTESGIKLFDSAPSIHEAVQALGRDTSSPLFGIAHQGVTEFNRTRKMGNVGSIIAENVRRSLHLGVNMEITQLTGSVSFLATCANTAPFIGLFGTVWGIMTSFHAIGAMKSASLATVAPGISEALIATAIGLGVAIPATIAFNIFQGRIDSIESRLVDFAGIFLNRVQRELNATVSVKTAD